MIYRECVPSAHGVCSSLLSVQRLGDRKNPRLTINNEQPLGRLIGAGSADLVAYGHLVVIAGLNLKDDAETGTQEQIHSETRILRD